MVLLQITIPTFNRAEQLAYCLKSVENALIHLPHELKGKVGIRIHNNSTGSYHEYSTVIDKYRTIFEDHDVGYFNYVITGFDIGSVSNCCGALFSSDAEYTWFLPDDDLARFDSIHTILRVIIELSPSMIHGGVQHKSSLSYDQIEQPYESSEDKEVNAVYKSISVDKIVPLFSMNVVQAQEHVYKTSAIKEVLYNDHYLELLNEMCPAFFSIISARSEGPLIFLTQSIGLYRNGEPNSAWRHRWLSLSLQTWPLLLRSCLSRALVSIEELGVGNSVFVGNLAIINYRPDILLGLRKRYQISPVLLFQFYGSTYVKVLLLSPYRLLIKVFDKILSKNSRK
jgi:hypothetical protein